MSLLLSVAFIFHRSSTATPCLSGRSNHHRYRHPVWEAGLLDFQVYPGRSANSDCNLVGNSDRFLSVRLLLAHGFAEALIHAHHRHIQQAGGGSHAEVAT